MDKCLLDTDTFSGILKGKNQYVVAHANAYRTEFVSYTLSSATIMEIVKGFQRVQQEHRLQQVLANLTHVEILPFDTECAILAGRIYGDLERAGQPIGRIDPMIASIAIIHNLVLVTGNTNHYERILKLGYPLKVQSWHQ